MNRYLEFMMVLFSPQPLKFFVYTVYQYQESPCQLSCLENLLIRTHFLL